MKKIIKEVGTKYRAKCPHCDTEFEYQRGDLFFSLFGYDDRYVSCPVCFRSIPHDDSTPRSKTSIMYG